MNKDKNLLPTNAVLPGVKKGLTTAELAKEWMDTFVMTNEIRRDMEEHDKWMKAYMGRRDVEMMYGEESEKFDRRKFGKMMCGFCEHKFNPFYVKTLKEKGEFEWRWQGTEYKEPEQDYECKCPKCNEELRFQIYIAQ